MDFRLNCGEFDEYMTRKERLNGGIHYVFKFENNYGASIVKGPFTYGGPQNLWELAVIRYDEDGKCDLDCSTEITGDVEGYLNDHEVLELLARIKSLENPDK